MSDSGNPTTSTTEDDHPEEVRAHPASGDSDHKGSSDGKNDGESEGGTILDDGGIDTDERAGRSLGIDPTAEPDDETAKEIEEEREERLDPENRPENAEVDNTQRDFDVDRGQFTDSEDYDDSDPAPYVDPEDPNSSAGADSDEDTGDESDGGSSDESSDGSAEKDVEPGQDQQADEDD